MSQKSVGLASLEMKLEILNLNHWEHYKFAQDLARALGPTNPRYQRTQEIVNQMVAEINTIQKEIDKIKTPT